MEKEDFIISEIKKLLKEENSSQTMRLKMFDRLKGKHHNTIILIRYGNNYESYKEDTTHIGLVSNIDETYFNHNGDDISVISFPMSKLDKILTNLIQSGFRVAIYDTSL
ncbi:hypothetical protein [Phocaeicola coprocola]|jgi:DNA mismatch repair ATPase MutS|uniref:hypothetical protein n=1 Tax=Phocaeicola coprocola TaxID=310298 RepID=UPI00206837D7|nr:hypothetical protein [Phocaeicola coprocola]DAZ83880.1 MAG TPA: MutS domain I [Caudoviricetes sp.]